MAETARPNSITGVTTPQHYRDRFRTSQVDHVMGEITDTMGENLGVSSSVGTSINIANGQAGVQGMLYSLSGGPLNLSTGGNPAGSSRFDVVALTYDDTHDPIVYARIIQGTAGAGLPATTNVTTGIWDYPIAHYSKSPAGVISGIVDRRLFIDGNGRALGKDVFGAGATISGNYMQGWFTPALRIGAEQVFYPSMNVWTWDGSVWAIKEGVFRASANMTKNNNTTLGAISGLAFPVHANSFYVFDGFIRYSSSSATPDIKVGMTFPVGTTAYWSGVGLYQSQTATTGVQGISERIQTAVYEYGTIGGPSILAGRPQGIIITGANSGLIQFTMAQNTAAAENSIVYSESYMHVRKCA